MGSPRTDSEFMVPGLISPVPVGARGLISVLAVVGETVGLGALEMVLLFPGGGGYREGAREGA